MKNNFLLLCCLYFFLSTSASAHKPTDSIDVAMETRLAKLYTEWGTKKLEALIAQNATNDAKGESFKNSYIIDFEQALATEPTCAEYVKNYTPNTWAAAPYEHFTSKQELETFLQKYNTELFTTKGTGTHIYFGYNLFLGRIITTSFIETLSSDGLKIEGSTKKDFQAVRTNFDAILSNIKQAVCPADNKWVIITYGRWRENLSQSGDEFGYGYWKTEKATSVSTVSNIDLGFAKIGVSNLAKDDLLGKAKLAFDAVRDALTGENLLGAASKFISLEAKNQPAFYNANRDKILEAAGLINDLGVEFDSLQVYCTQNPSNATDLGFCIGTGIGDIAIIDKLILTLKSLIKTRTDLATCAAVYADIKTYLEVLPFTLMRQLPLSSRVCALKKSAEGNIAGDWFGLGNAKEPMIFRLIDTTPNQDANGLLDNLISPANNIGSQCLLTKIVEGTHDSPILSNNYGDLILAITKVIIAANDEKYNLPQTPSYFGKTKTELDAAIKAYNDRIIDWGGPVTDFYFTNPTGVNNQGWLDSEFRWRSIALNPNGTIDLHATKKRVSKGLPNNVISSIYVDNQSLNPFVLVYLINNADLSINDGHLGNLVPALFLKYARDKNYNRQALSVAISAIDAFTIAKGLPVSGLLERATTEAVRWLRYWRYYQVAAETALYAGSWTNLLINAAQIKDPQMQGWVDDYNLAMATISAPYLVENVLKIGNTTINKFGSGLVSILKPQDGTLNLARTLTRDVKIRLVIWSEKLKEYNTTKQLFNDQPLFDEANQLAKLVEDADPTLYNLAINEAKDFDLVYEIKDKKWILREVISIEKILNTLSPETKAIHNRLVAGGVKFEVKENTIKYLTRNGQEVAKIEGGVFIVVPAKANIPLPTSYLSNTYIANHINKFKAEGGAFVIRKSDLANIDYVSIAPRKFVGLKSEMDAVIAKFNNSNKNPQVLIDELDLGGNYFNRPNDEIYFVTVEPNKGFIFDMPNGNEGGAYEGFWVPGGYTKHGTAEAIIANSGTFRHNNSLETFTSFFGTNNVVKIK